MSIQILISDQLNVMDEQNKTQISDINDASDQNAFDQAASKNSEAKEIIRVSISEAAKLFGVNSQTIRRAIGNEEMTYVVVGGRYKINFESLVKWSQRKTTVRNKSNEHGIGQFVSQWKISNTLYSPTSKTIKPQKTARTNIQRPKTDTP